MCTKIRRFADEALRGRLEPGGGNSDRFAFDLTRPVSLHTRILLDKLPNRKEMSKSTLGVQANTPRMERGGVAGHTEVASAVQARL